jgi:hypothetical protein
VAEEEIRGSLLAFFLVVERKMEEVNGGRWGN